MKFFVARLSFIPSIKRESEKTSFEGKPIELAERLLMENNQYYIKDKRGPPQLYFKDFIHELTYEYGSKLLAGKIYLRLKEHYFYNRENIQYTEGYPYYQSIHFLWDRKHQLIFLEEKSMFFGYYEFLIKSIESHFNDLFESYEYSVYIEPLTEKEDFWKTINSFKYLQEAIFVLHMPNYGDGHEHLKKMLNEYKGITNSSSTTFGFTNKRGKLKFVSKDILEELLKWISKGSGLWKLIGIQWGRDKESIISSEKDGYIKRAETDLESIELNSENVKNKLYDLVKKISLDEDIDDYKEE